MFSKKTSIAPLRKIKPKIPPPSLNKHVFKTHTHPTSHTHSRCRQNSSFLVFGEEWNTHCRFCNQPWICDERTSHLYFALSYWYFDCPGVLYIWQCISWRSKVTPHPLGDSREIGHAGVLCYVSHSVWNVCRSSYPQVSGFKSKTSWLCIRKKSPPLSCWWQRKNTFYRHFYPLLPPAPPSRRLPWGRGRTNCP